MDPLIYITIFIVIGVFFLLIFLYSSSKNTTTTTPVEEFLVFAKNAGLNFFQCIQENASTPCGIWDPITSPASLDQFIRCNNTLYVTDSSHSLSYLDGSSYVQTIQGNITFLTCFFEVLGFVTGDNELFTCSDPQCDLVVGFDPGNQPSSLITNFQIINQNGVNVYFIADIFNQLYYFSTGEIDGWKLSNFPLPSLPIPDVLIPKPYIMKGLGDILIIVDNTFTFGNYPIVGYFTNYPPSVTNFVNIMTSNDQVLIGKVPIESITLSGDLLYIIINQNNLLYKDITNVGSDFISNGMAPIEDFGD